MKHRKMRLDSILAIIIAVSAIWFIIFLINMSINKGKTEAEIHENMNYNTAETYKPVYMHTTIAMIETQIYPYRLANAIGEVPEDTKDLLDAYDKAFVSLTEDVIFEQHEDIRDAFELAYNCVLRALALMVGEMEDENQTAEDYFDGAEAYFGQALGLIGVDYYSVPQFISEEKINEDFRIVHDRYMQQLVDVCDALQAELPLLNFNNQQEFLISSTGFLKKLMYNIHNIYVLWEAPKEEGDLVLYNDLIYFYENITEMLASGVAKNTWLTPEDYFIFTSDLLFSIRDVNATANYEYGIYASENVSALLDGTYYRDKYGVWRKGEANILYVLEEDGTYRQAIDSDYESDAKLYIKNENGEYHETLLEGVKEYEYNEDQHYEGDGHDHSND